jgi:prepilin-type processing-associated H-X9-DG protein
MSKEKNAEAKRKRNYRKEKERALKNRIKKIQEPTYMSNQSTKKGLLLPSANVLLTRTEREMLDFIVKDHLISKQIQSIKKVTKQAVDKTIRRLKKKGAINSGWQPSKIYQSTSQPSGIKRLHGQEFNIWLLFQNHYYQEIRMYANILYIDGHTIRLYKDSILGIVTKSEIKSTNEILTELQKQEKKVINWHALYRVLMELYDDGKIERLKSKAGFFWKKK